MTIILPDPVDPGIGTPSPDPPPEPADVPIPHKERQLTVELHSPGGHLRMGTAESPTLTRRSVTKRLHG